jgi:sec-independent protein translocase protein TatC
MAAPLMLLYGLSILIVKAVNPYVEDEDEDEDSSKAENTEDNS